MTQQRQRQTRVRLPTTTPNCSFSVRQSSVIPGVLTIPNPIHISQPGLKPFQRCLIVVLKIFGWLQILQ